MDSAIAKGNDAPIKAIHPLAQWMIDPLLARIVNVLGELSFSLNAWMNKEDKTLDLCSIISRNGFGSLACSICASEFFGFISDQINNKFGEHKHRDDDWWVDQILDTLMTSADGLNDSLGFLLRIYGKVQGRRTQLFSLMVDGKDGRHNVNYRQLRRFLQKK
jgi:hypothetical protein